jgi:cytochrome c oxidase assembly protein subunit 15
MLPTHRRTIGLWLALWAAMVLLTVVIGGITRLTESGLSITEWKPVSGVLPPLSATDWEAEFSRYRQIPEYQVHNTGMTLAGFKQIYLVEYVHRLWARLVGLAFAVPFLVFSARRMLDGPLARRLGLLLVLLALQGAMGWYMVKSGLTLRTDVSQYRLAAHLGLALVIYVITVWTAADLLSGGQSASRSVGTPVRPSDPPTAWGGLRWVAAGFAAYVFITILSGAFVAGLDAGKTWNTFPLMGGSVVPPGYGALSPWYLNLFENPAAVQFHHRLLGVGVLFGAFALWAAGRRSAPASAQRPLAALALLAMAQAGLGVATLLLRVPIPIAALHQAGAVLVLTAAVLALHGFQTTNGRRKAPAVVS